MPVQDPYASIAKPLSDDPYASIAKPLSDDPYASIAKGTGQGESPNYSPDTTVVNPTFSQIGTGALREGANLLSGAHAFGRKVLEAIPGVKNSGFGQSMEQHQGTLDEMARPRNMGEAFGRTGAEMASYLIPAKAESMAGKAAEELPGLLRPAARIGTSAMSNAAMSGMNRQSPVVGGAVGAGAGLLGEGSRMLANPLMRSAIPGNIGKDSAAAVLKHTTGIRPATVLGNVEGKIGEAGRNLDAAVKAPGVQPVSLTPAMAPVSELKTTAARLGVPDLDQKANEFIDWLRGNAVSGQQYGNAVDPETALNIRRGGDELFGGNRIWKQDTNPRAQSTFKQSRAALSNALHQSAPGATEADEMMHNLIPARTGLRALERTDPSVAANVMGRVGARTGALTGAAMGGAAGARSAGLPGAIAGGLTGLIAPEVMSAPAAKIALARAAYSTIPPKFTRAIATPAIDALMDQIRQKRTGGQD